VWCCTGFTTRVPDLTANGDGGPPMSNVDLLPGACFIYTRVMSHHINIFGVGTIQYGMVSPSQSKLSVVGQTRTLALNKFFLPSKTSGSWQCERESFRICVPLGALVKVFVAMRSLHVYAARFSQKHVYPSRPFICTAARIRQSSYVLAVWATF
jgi:hypothetical protein